MPAEPKEPLSPVAEAAIRQRAALWQADAPYHTIKDSVWDDRAALLRELDRVRGELNHLITLRGEAEEELALARLRTASDTIACVFCKGGEVSTWAPDAAEQIAGHLARCEKHPIHAFVRQRDQALSHAVALRAELDETIMGNAALHDRIGELSHELSFLRPVVEAARRAVSGPGVISVAEWDALVKAVAEYDEGGG